MADFRRRGRSFLPRQTSRDWARSISTALVVVPAASKVLLAGFAATEDVTVRRVLGRYYVQSDQVSVQEQQVGAIGGLVVSDLAFTAGAASIPGPVTERSDDVWALWEPFMQTNERVADTGVGLNSQGPWSFDSKGQRKLAQGATYVVMIENASGVFGLEVMIAVSLLVSH